MDTAGHKALDALLARLAKDFGDFPHPAPPLNDTIPKGLALVHHLLYDLLLFEASIAQADAAYPKLVAGVVSLNDLRVTTPDEIHALLGDKYPLGLERATRIRYVLWDIHKRFHAIDLAPVLELPKRDARALLESLEGVPPFVAHRLALLRLDIHAFPVDDRLATLLHSNNVIDDAHAPLDKASSFLEHHIRAADATKAHALLQAWSDRDGKAPRGDRGLAIRPLFELEQVDHAVAQSARTSLKRTNNAKSKHAPQSQPKPQSQSQSPSRRRPKP
ncbi:MAG: hypothetical protein AB7Q00_10290 [Phycisphaerales bacterium]|nr:MAG: hypothetical protein IPK69_13685 [Phycisphaerales bacterium]